MMPPAGGGNSGGGPPSLNIPLGTDGRLEPTFLCFRYKIDPCGKPFPHDWATCVAAHVGERAARRCPVRVGYKAIACPFAKRRLPCPDGDACLAAHSLFEYWLHPQRYRTEMCQHGTACTRPVCFFAHEETEMRPLDPSLPPAELCWGTGAAQRASAAQRLVTGRATVGASLAYAPAAQPPGLGGALPVGLASMQGLASALPGAGLASPLLVNGGVLQASLPALGPGGMPSAGFGGPQGLLIGGGPAPPGIPGHQLLLGHSGAGAAAANTALLQQQAIFLQQQQQRQHATLQAQALGLQANGALSSGAGAQQLAAAGLQLPTNAAVAAGALPQLPLGMALHTTIGGMAGLVPHAAAGLDAGSGVPQTAASGALLMAPAALAQGGASPGAAAAAAASALQQQQQQQQQSYQQQQLVHQQHLQHHQQQQLQALQQLEQQHTAVGASLPAAAPVLPAAAVSSAEAAPPELTQQQIELQLQQLQAQLQAQVLGPRQ